MGWILRPFGALFCVVVRIRRWGYVRGWFASLRLPVPVIVVGNLTVGGTGKTPTVLWIAQFLVSHGWRPGVVSRGYGGRVDDRPRTVDPSDSPTEVGDEPLLLARRSGVPVAVCRWRGRAGAWLYTQHGCNCLIADDGLQHYALERDLEIVLLDRTRGTNERCLPAGPFREPLQRLAEVPLRIAYGSSLPGEHALTLTPLDAVALAENTPPRSLASFRETLVHAVAGIGHPLRFFSLLRAAGLCILEHPFPDHHPFCPEDLDFGDPLPVLMTEKDAVKCFPFSRPGHWYVPVSAVFSPAFGAALLAHLPPPPRDCPYG